MQNNHQSKIKANRNQLIIKQLSSVLDQKCAKNATKPEQITQQQKSEWTISKTTPGVA